MIIENATPRYPIESILDILTFFMKASRTIAETANNVICVDTLAWTSNGHCCSIHILLVHVRTIAIDRIVTNIFPDERYVLLMSVYINSIRAEPIGTIIATHSYILEGHDPIFVTYQIVKGIIIMNTTDKTSVLAASFIFIFSLK